MGSENQIHERIILSDLLHHMLFLHHASEEDDLHLRVCSFDAFQMTQMSVDLLVCILTHRTGVKDHDGSLFRTIGLCKAHTKGHARHGFRLEGIHLTSLVLDQKPGVFRIFVFEKFSAFLDILILDIGFVDFL